MPALSRGHKRVSVRGSIHGCMPVGMSMASCAARAAFASHSASRNAAGSGVSEATGATFLSSITCATSSLDHPSAPRATSDAGSPASAARSSSAHARTSSEARSTIAYSSSRPTPANAGSGSVRGEAPALAGTTEEDSEHLAIERIAEDRVLVAGIDVGIVVDFDDIAAVADLLQVDAVETVADQVRGTTR